MIVILHNIRSLHNVGSIFRTADAAGIDKLYLCGITPTPLDRFGSIRPQLGKVALGAEKTVPWQKSASTSRLIKQLQKDGFTIFAVEQAKTAIPYFTLKINNSNLEKTALILGAEVAGLPPTILKQCDTIIEIPMLGRKESLNVGVAFGIVVFHLIAHRWIKKS